MPWAYRGIVSGIELGEWSAVIAFVLLGPCLRKGASSVQSVYRLCSLQHGRPPIHQDLLFQ